MRNNPYIYGIKGRLQSVITLLPHHIYMLIAGLYIFWGFTFLMPHIYKITSPSGRIYVGSTIDIKRRFRHYRKKLAFSQPKLHASFKKYGIDAHVFEVVAECTIDEMLELEAFYGLQFDVLGKTGLNCALPKKGDVFICTTEETRAKQSASLKGKNTWTKGRIMADEQKEYMRNLFKGKPSGMKGVNKSEETKAKIAASHIGIRPGTRTIEKLKNRVFTEDTRQKMSASQIKRYENYTFTDEERKAASERGKGNKSRTGMRYTDEEKAEMSRLRRINPPCAKKIINIETKEVCFGTRELAEKLKIPRSSLKCMLNGGMVNKTPYRYAV